MVWAASGPTGVGGTGAQVLARTFGQSGGEGAASKVIAPGFEPLGVTSASAAVNMFVRQPPTSPPQSPS